MRHTTTNTDLAHHIRVINNLGPLPHATCQPHCGVDMIVAHVARVHADEESELVQAGIDIVGLGGVVEGLQHVWRSRPPSISLDLDVGRLLVRCLEEIAGVQLGR